ncbi:sodium ion-translocating decarboxylase subunit beta [Bovifimicola ammoniilytica]|uniref:sodium ion-translocating decarboxylase subunit beta n=1 Tax=Bovifimicola ammoniilytica TaxID=2981720 RepID=UPI000821B3C9|nr:sodium ion-translocating decarboxylase subunit beta [Bovifimicola ammoniilytica]MCU6752585.1 sodium ion-translocating decarboxylase subunit beta [Bovifimicola ammoniilytica]SCJ29930.1 Glutaconyl-CoA decarboxylase subunit beta [uncultured Eubacterium sp.]
MGYVVDTLGNLLHQTAFFNLTWGNYVMILVALVFLYLAIAKEYEPLLLVPIAFGMLLVNMYPDIMLSIKDSDNGVGGLLHYFYLLDEWSILPSLIFLGVGAMTDFGPLIANPKCFILGAAAQFGIYVAYFLAIFMGFSDKAAAAISIIGGADGPTSIFLAGKLGQTALMGPIAVAAYSYMSLVPIIQPPIMKLLTTEKERKIKMEQLRPVSKLEKILFPIIITVVVVLILPTTAPLVGMLMLGNLFRECGVVKQLTETASNALMYIVVILLGTSVGATTSAEAFLNMNTIKIVILGLVAFAFGTAAGVVIGKVMCKVTKGKINPLIGSAGVSAVPMAARVSQKVGSESDPTNFLLMHAMGPNVAGVIGTAVAAGTFMAIFGIGA